MQPSIPQCNERKAAYPDDVIQRIDKVIMDMIIVDNWTCCHILLSRAKRSTA